jgi:hypothetical protein
MEFRIQGRNIVDFFFTIIQVEEIAIFVDKMHKVELVTL